MPIREYICKDHGKFEGIVFSKEPDQNLTKPCPECAVESPEVEWSIPARRNPEHGIQ